MVGKTSIINRFIFDVFDEKSPVSLIIKPTIGIDFISKTMTSGDRVLRLQLW
jgi:GTPase SAR1 family protein